MYVVFSIALLTLIYTAWIQLDEPYTLFGFVCVEHGADEFGQRQSKPRRYRG
jgi:hypothetical protein